MSACRWGEWVTNVLGPDKVIYTKRQYLTDGDKGEVGPILIKSVNIATDVLRIAVT